MIGDVRGCGMFLGVDLVLDGATRAPNARAGSQIVRRLKDQHRILLQTDGPADNVLKFKSPLCFQQKDADR